MIARLAQLRAAAAALDLAQLAAFDNSPHALAIEERRREIDEEIFEIEAQPAPERGWSERTRAAG